MSRSCSRLSAIAVIVAAGLVVAACGGTSATGTSATGTSATGTSATGTSSNGTSATGTSSNGTSAPGGTSSSTSATTRYTSAKATVIGKSTHVVVNPAISAAIKHDGISVTAIAPASAKTTLLFPVSGGQIVVTTLAGTIDHTGGLIYHHSGKSITLTNFVINTITKRLTATVGGQSKPIFDLNLAPPRRVSGPRSKVVASTIKLTITSQAATALNSSLGVSTFRAGMNFGSARLIVAYARGRR